jgi:molybdopterin-guanine dinucleotide biosynthesis protein A
VASNDPADATTVARSGLVVAGGRSERFGDREKALAPVEGTPMLRRVVDRVAPLVEDLVVNCRADQRVGFDAVLAPDHAVRFALDPVADEGPLHGLRTGLAAARGEYTVVLACDLPRVSPALLRELVATAEGAAGAVPVVDGVRQPLCAVYRTESARSACVTAIDGGSDSLQAVLDALDPATTPERDVAKVCDPDTLESVNRPGALEPAAQEID